jgi:hypothetical protein
MSNPGSEATEQLPEEERQESLFDDHQEEMEVSDDLSFYRQPKTKIHFRHTDTNLVSKPNPASQVDREINMEQTLMT